MKQQSKSREMHGSVSIAFVFLFLFGMVHSTYALSNVKTDHLLIVQDTTGPVKHITSDSLSFGQPGMSPGEDQAVITDMSKEEMKAHRKAKADRFWTNVLLGFIALLLNNGCCDCDDD